MAAAEEQYEDDVAAQAMAMAAAIVMEHDDEEEETDSDSEAEMLMQLEEYVCNHFSLNIMINGCAICNAYQCLKSGLFLYFYKFESFVL